VVEDSVLLGGVIVKAGATVRYAILDTNVTVGVNAVVGEDKATAAGIAVIGAGYCVADGATVPAAAMISDN
jgi:glucose-1-phosphate adenylyltransferase